jgi:hypothetical protein
MPLSSRATLTAIFLGASLMTGQAQTTQDPHHPPGGPAAGQAPGQAGMPGPGIGGGGQSSGAAAMMGGDMRQMMEMMNRMMGGMAGPGTPGTESDVTHLGQMMRSMGEMMGAMGRMMEEGDMGGMTETTPLAPAERRIAHLKSELGITAAQEPQWAAFADALRTGRQKIREAYAEALRDGLPVSVPDRAELRVKLLSTALDALKATVSAEKSLYAVLSDDQKRIGDELLSVPMGRM